MTILKRINQSTVIGSVNDLYEAGTLIIDQYDNKVRYYDGSTNGGNLVYPPTGINDPDNIGANVLRVANGVLETSYSMVVAPGSSSPAPYLSGFGGGSFIDQVSVGNLSLNSNGNVVFPDASVQVTAYPGILLGGGGGGAGGNVIQFGNMRFDGTGIRWPDNTIQTSAWDGSASKLVNGSSYANIADAGGNLVVSINNDNMSWTFANDGAIYGKINYNTILSAIDSGDTPQVKQVIADTNLNHLSRTYLDRYSYSIELDLQGSYKQWQFNGNELRTPDNGSVIRGFNSSVAVQAMNAGGNPVASIQSVSNQNDPNVFTSIDATTSGANIVVYSAGSASGPGLTWQFSNDGNLTLPGNVFAVKYANGTTVNLDGPVANANYANIAGSAYSVALANVSDAGNIASTNLDGNVGNVLRGDGTWGAAASQYGDSNVASLLGSFGSNTISTTGNIVGGNLLPSANVTYDLGSPTQRWKDIYLSNNTIFLGDAEISANGSGVTINGNHVVTSSGSVLDLGSNANILISGGTNGQVLTTDGTGNLSWTTVSGGGDANYANYAGEAFYVSGGNVVGEVANATFATNAGTINAANVVGEVGNANYAVYALNAINVNGGNVVGPVGSADTANSATVADSANSVAGANVTGEVANANYAAYANVATLANSATVADSANSVAVANVTGIGNIATLNLNGNSSTVLYGNGVFAAASGGSGSNISNGNSNVDIATANGNVTIAAGGNSVVTVTSTGANITGTANISGNANVGNLGVAAIVATANVSTTGYFISGNQATGGFQLGNSNSRLKSGDGNSYMTMGQNPSIYPDTSASASAGVLIGGSGYILGNNGSRNITLNYAGTSGVVGLQSNVQVGTSGSGTVLVPGTNITGANAILAGPTFTPLANTMAGFVSNINSYTQLTIQNKSNGSDATTDFIATADNGTDNTNYLDIGIINSGYDNATPTNSLGNIVSAADGYIYTQGNTSNTSQSGGNLAIGTTVAGKTVKIFAGGVTNASIVANIANTGISVTGNLSVSGNVSGNTAGFAIGYRDVPQIVASNATLALTDAGKHFYSTTAGNVTLTIPTNANVAFPVGTAIMLVVQAAGNILVNAASGVNMYLAGNSTAANRVVGTFGMATMIKVASDTWFINGTGVS